MKLLLKFAAGCEGHAGEQRVDVGERAAGGPHAGARVVGRGHRAGGGRVESAGGDVRQGQRGGDVGAVHVAHHDVGQVQRRVFGVGLGRAQVGRGRRVVDRDAGHRLAAGDRRGDAVADAGGDREVAVEVGRRGEGHAGEQRVDVGDRAARGPHAGAGVVGRGHRARGGGARARRRRRSTASASR